MPSPACKQKIVHVFFKTSYRITNSYNTLGILYSIA